MEEPTTAKRARGSTSIGSNSNSDSNGTGSNGRSGYGTTVRTNDRRNRRPRHGNAVLRRVARA